MGLYRRVILYGLFLWFFVSNSLVDAAKGDSPKKYQYRPPSALTGDATLAIPVHTPDGPTTDNNAAQDPQPTVDQSDTTEAEQQQPSSAATVTQEADVPPTLTPDNTKGPSTVSKKPKGPQQATKTPVPPKNPAQSTKTQFATGSKTVATVKKPASKTPSNDGDSSTGVFQSFRDIVDTIKPIANTVVSEFLANDKNKKPVKTSPKKPTNKPTIGSPSSTPSKSKPTSPQTMPVVVSGSNAKINTNPNSNDDYDVPPALDPLLSLFSLNKRPQKTPGTPGETQNIPTEAETPSKPQTQVKPVKTPVKPSTKPETPTEPSDEPTPQDESTPLHAPQNEGDSETTNGHDTTMAHESEIETNIKETQPSINTANANKKPKPSAAESKTKPSVKKTQAGSGSWEQSDTKGSTEDKLGHEDGDSTGEPQEHLTKNERKPINQEKKPQNTLASKIKPQQNNAKGQVKEQKDTGESDGDAMPEIEIDYTSPIEDKPATSKAQAQGSAKVQGNAKAQGSAKAPTQSGAKAPLKTPQPVIGDQPPETQSDNTPDTTQKGSWEATENELGSMQIPPQKADDPKKTQNDNNKGKNAKQQNSQGNSKITALGSQGKGKAPNKQSGNQNDQAYITVEDPLNVHPAHSNLANIFQLKPGSHLVAIGNKKPAQADSSAQQTDTTGDNNDNGSGETGIKDQLNLKPENPTSKQSGTSKVPLKTSSSGVTGSAYPAALLALQHKLGWPRPSPDSGSHGPAGTPDRSNEAADDGYGPGTMAISYIPPKQDTVGKVGGSTSSATKTPPADTKGARIEKNQTEECNAVPKSQCGIVECRDYSTERFCLDVIKLRNRTHCLDDMYFGRFQCCKTCAMQLGAKSLNKSDPVVQMLSTPKTCEDAPASDGKSYTSYCMKMLGITKREITSDLRKTACALREFQHKCLKTCGLCTDPPTTTSAPTTTTSTAPPVPAVKPLPVTTVSKPVVFEEIKLHGKMNKKF